MLLADFAGRMVGGDRKYGQLHGQSSATVFQDQIDLVKLCAVQICTEGYISPISPKDAIAPLQFNFAFHFSSVQAPNKHFTLSLSWVSLVVTSSKTVDSRLAVTKR